MNDKLIIMDNTTIAAAVFDLRANDYAARFMDVTMYSGQLDILCAEIPKNGKVLDVACGPGNVARYLLDRRSDMLLTGIDLAPAMVALATANNPEAEFSVMDCRNISELPDRYDCVICSFVMPYLSKEEALHLIASAGMLLKSGGLLYISTMEDDYTKSGPQRSSKGDELYMYFHEADYIIKATAAAGMNIINECRYTYPDAKGGVVVDLCLVGRKGII